MLGREQASGVAPTTPHFAKACKKMGDPKGAQIIGPDSPNFLTVCESGGLENDPKGRPHSVRASVLPAFGQVNIERPPEMAMDNFGIDTNRIYFREEIAKMWGYDDPDKENQRKWFLRNFTKKGLKSRAVAGRRVVHGYHLAQWIEYGSSSGEE